MNNAELSHINDLGSGAGAQNLPELLQAGIALHQVRSQNQLSVSALRPRDLEVIEKAVIKEARLAGDEFFYSWVVKNSDGTRGEVSGISYSGAIILARNFRNCSIECDRVEDIGDSHIIYSTFVDFENNYTISRGFKISKRFKIFGRMDEERKEDIRFQIGQSKSMRNVAMAGVPAWLAQRAFKAAREAVKTKIQEEIDKYDAAGKDGLAIVQTQVVEKLKKQGVSEAAICQKFDIEKVANLDVNMLASIYGDLVALSKKEETVENLYPEEKAKKEPEAEAEGKVDDKVDALKKRLAEKDKEPEPERKDETDTNAKAEPEKKSTDEPDEDEVKKSEYCESVLQQGFEHANSLYMDMKPAKPSLADFFAEQKKTARANSPITKMKNAPPNFKTLWDFSSILAAELLFEMAKNSGGSDSTTK